MRRRSPIIGTIFPTAKERMEREALERSKKGPDPPPEVELPRRTRAEPPHPPQRSAEAPWEDMDPQEAMELQILAAAQAFADSVGD